MTGINMSFRLNFFQKLISVPAQMFLDPRVQLDGQVNLIQICTY